MPECIVVWKAEPLIVVRYINVKVDATIFVEDIVAAKRIAGREEVEWVDILPGRTVPLTL